MTFRAENGLEILSGTPPLHPHPHPTPPLSEGRLSGGEACICYHMYIVHDTVSHIESPTECLNIPCKLRLPSVSHILLCRPMEMQTVNIFGQVCCNIEIFYGPSSNRQHQQPWPVSFVLAWKSTQKWYTVKPGNWLHPRGLWKFVTGFWGGLISQVFCCVLNRHRDWSSCP